MSGAFLMPSVCRSQSRLFDLLVHSYNGNLFDMTAADIATFRLVSQQLNGTTHQTAKDLVGYLGAMQAQDYNMAKWAIGARLPGSTDTEIEKAIDKGGIVRTHVLRPTWHFVAAKDIRWMLALTAPHIHSSCAGIYRRMNIDGPLIRKSNDLVAKALEGGKQLTREELMQILAKTGINTDDMRSSFLMFHAELDGIVCNGSRRGKQQTYALLDERVPPTKPLLREEALARLAERYFISHGPATLADFCWWSGLPVKDARAGLAAVQSKLVSARFGEAEYWFPGNIETPGRSFKSVLFLPAFDEFTISYKDRRASIEPNHARHVMTNNGIFKPIIVLNGKVAGAWQRSIKKDTVSIGYTCFAEPSPALKKQLATAAAKVGAFLNLKTDIS